MAFPKAVLTLNEVAREVAYEIPCPCGRNGLVRSRFVIGQDDYRKRMESRECGACKRVCAPEIIVQNSLQKVIKFEYHYTELSDPAYWAAHAKIMEGCSAAIGDEIVHMLRRIRDGEIMFSKTFACWWEDRLGLVPTLIFQQNLPMEEN